MASRIKAAQFACLGILLVFASNQSSSTTAADHQPALWLQRSAGVVKIAPEDGAHLLSLPLTFHGQRLALDGPRAVLWVYGHRFLQGFLADGSSLTGTFLPQLVTSPFRLHLAVDDSSGHAWVAQYRTLHRISEDGQRQFSIELPQAVDAIEASPGNGVLYLAAGSDVFRVDPDGAMSVVLSPAAGTVSALARDHEAGMLWLSTQQQVLAYSEAGELRYSLPLSGVQHIRADGAFAWWMASAHHLYRVYGNGILEFSLRPFAAAGLETIVALTPDLVDGDVWVGGRQNLVHVRADGVVAREFRLSQLAGAGLLVDLAYYLDRWPPEVSVLAPEEHAYLATLQPELTVQAADKGAGVDPDTFGLYANDTSVSVECANLPDQASVFQCMPSIELSEGAHQLKVSVRDFQGNEAETTPHFLYLDITAPQIIADLPGNEGWVSTPALLLAGSLSEPGRLWYDTTEIMAGSDGTFTVPLALDEGPNNILLRAEDRAGNEATEVVVLVLDTVSPPPLTQEAVTLTIEVDGGILLSGNVPEPGVLLEILAGDQVLHYQTNDTGAFTIMLAASPGQTIRITLIDRAGNRSTTLDLAVPENVGELPPDPSLVAPALERGVYTPLMDQVSFLFSGNEQIQRDVQPDALQEYRVGVLRGMVRTRSGEPLPGVTVRIDQQPEIGHTLSRADGLFDLVVNAGATLTVTYLRDGYLPVQRKVTVPWQDYVWLPDVVMVQLDDRVTTVDFNSDQPVQVVRGNSVSDRSGERQATVMIRRGTTAELVMADGSIRPVSSLNLRATEYTVGDAGLAAMPGELPPTSGYTYAVELSADEALEAGATDVRFSQPVHFYLENFLEFPVGGIVPAGWYDRARAAWIPSENGRIVSVLAIESGMAVLDVDGAGQPASESALTALLINEDERREIAALYQAGESFWRVPMTHFTPWDCNWPLGPPGDAEPPPDEPGEPDEPEQPDEPEPKPDIECSSIIECQNQTLGKRIGLTGTGMTLNYRSDRLPGRRSTRTLSIPLSGNSVPESLRRIDLEIRIAGKVIREEFPAQPNQVYSFLWDGTDAYGRELSGSWDANVKIDYVYPAQYYEPAEFVRSFARVGTRFAEPLIGRNTQRAEISISRTWQRRLTVIDERHRGLGGWSLDVHHRFGVTERGVYYGDGRRRVPSSAGDTIQAFAGTGQGITGGDGGAAAEAGLGNVYGVAEAPDGTVYIVNSNQIRRIGVDGIISTYAGGSSSGFFGDGGPALSARFANPQGLAVSADGSLYIADANNHRIRRISPDGIVTTVAGNGAAGFAGDGGPATAAMLQSPRDIALTPDGGFYIADTNNLRIRYVSPDGEISTVAGTGLFGSTGDGGPATYARIAAVTHIELDAEGGLLLSGGDRIRRISVEGTINTIAGTGRAGFSGDGLHARQAEFRSPRGLAVAADGSIFVVDSGNYRIRHIRPDGIIVTVAGNGQFGSTGNDGAAHLARFRFPYALELTRKGDLLVADTSAYQVRRIGRLWGGFGPEAQIVSEDGTEIHEFDIRGRHLRTRDAVTGVLLHSFVYDGSGYLSEVRDRRGRITRIERGAGGVPRALVTPDGQRNELETDARGLLVRVENPARDRYILDYNDEGLLTSVRDPRDALTEYDHDDMGRLVASRNAAGGGWQMVREVSDAVQTVLMTSAEGRESRYITDRLADGTEVQHRWRADGTRVTSSQRAQAEMEYVAADGTRTISRSEPDSRFGLLAPVQSESSVGTPGGRVQVRSETRSVELVDPRDVLSISSYEETTSINGRVLARRYETGDRLWRTVFPSGRESTVSLNERGEPVRVETTGLAPTLMAYDNAGRITTVTATSAERSRVHQFSYNAEGFLSSLTDAMDRTMSFDYDPAGRVTRQTFSDGRDIRYEYDAGGKLTALIPPGREPHVFEYDALGQETGYMPPPLASGPTPTRYRYNLDRRLTAIEHPGNRTVAFEYDDAGRLSAQTIQRGMYQYRYYATTGRLQQIVAPDGGLLDYSWDGFLPLSESWQGGISGSVNQSWNNNFWLQERCVNNDQCVNFSYDDDGLLTQAGALILQRDAANGLLNGAVLGAVMSDYSYNQFGELTGAALTHDNNTLANMSYTRDSLGRIVTRSETAAEATFSDSYDYDLAGRLVGVVRNGQGTTWQYDSNGNRTHENGQLIASYDQQDRLLHYRGATYQYTANGELSSKSEGGATTHYQYDELGNLVRVVLVGDIELDYVIDGRNRRIGKKVNGELVQGFLYQDQLNPVAELDGEGNVISRFVYAEKVNVPSYMIKGSNTYRIFSDHLGSPRLIVDIDTGAVAQRIVYDVWGNVKEDTNPGFQPFGFAGGVYDQHTKLTRFGARDYDPKTGRWTAKDPIGFVGRDANLYGYVFSDVVNLIDPDGLFVVAGMACFSVVNGATAYGAGKSAGELNEALSLHDEVIQRIDKEILTCESISELARLMDMRKDVLSSRQGLMSGLVGDFASASSFVDVPQTAAGNALCTILTLLAP